MAAEEAIQLILEEGARLLYESYVERRSFHFASTAIGNMLESELELRFVAHDAGEVTHGRRHVGSDNNHRSNSHGRSHSNSPAHSSSPSSRKSLASGAGAAAVAAASGRSPRLLDEWDAPNDGWSLEPEPVRCRIDTWARAVVPVRRKLVPAKGQPSVPEEDIQSSPRRAKSGSVVHFAGGRTTPQSSSNRAPSALSHVKSGAVNPEEERRTTCQRAIPLECEVNEEEEESYLREMKEREVRREKEEAARLKKKAAEAAEEVIQTAKSQDQFKDKPVAYDCDGNIILIEQLKVEKLPLAFPAPSYLCRQRSSEDRGVLVPTAPAQAKGKKGRPTRRKEKQFVDSFQSLASQQPSMIEAMTVVPGVELVERGHTKQGPSQSGGPMTRKDYEKMVQSGLSVGYPSAGNEGGSEAIADESTVPLAGTSTPPKGEGGTTPDDATAALSLGLGKLRAPVRSSVMRAPDDLGVELLPKPPAAPRPVQPVPPPMHRVQMKREAIGYDLSRRERANTGTGSRFPNCAAVPPLGATMGHGLCKAGEEFYFPAAGPQPLAPLSSGLVGSGSSPGSVMLSARESPRVPQGYIVSRNPELAKRLFQS